MFVIIKISVNISMITIVLIVVTLYVIIMSVSKCHISLIILRVELYVIMLSISIKNRLLQSVIKLGLDRLIVIIPCAASNYADYALSVITLSVIMRRIIFRNAIFNAIILSVIC